MRMQTVAGNVLYAPIQCTTSLLKTFCFLDLLIKKIQAACTYVFGYFVRIGVFMIGERNIRGAEGIMQFYRWCNGERVEPFDHSRLTKSKQVLESIGGREYTVTPSDNTASVRYMLLTYQDFVAKITAAGGSIQDIAAIPAGERAYSEIPSSETHARKVKLTVIRTPAQPTPEWELFAASLVKMNYRKVEIRSGGNTFQSYVTFEAPFDEQESPGNQDQCVLHCHTARRSYAMDRKYIGKILGAKLNICVFDYRNTWESTGYPTEGGYYLDARAVMERLYRTHGYQIPKIWATGFCAGGAIATSLKAEYHTQGINLSLDNTPASMASTIQNQPWPLSLLGRLGLDAIMSTDPAITSLVRQDCLNSLGKLQALPHYTGRQGGISVIMYSTNDTTLPLNDGPRMACAAQRIGRCYTMTRDIPDGEDGHLVDAVDDPYIWRNYVRLIRST